MKKILSILVLATLILSSFSMAVSAVDSPQGVITQVTGSETSPAAPIVTDIEGQTVEISELKDEEGKVIVDTADMIGALTNFEVENDAKDVPETFEEVIESFKESLPAKDFADAFEEAGEEPDLKEYKPYGEFRLELTDFGKKTIGENKLEVEITINVPGITEENKPFVYFYSYTTKSYTYVKSTINGSNITFTSLPLTHRASSIAAGSNDALNIALLSAADVEVLDTADGYYGVAYKGVAKSPSTGVETVAFVAVLVIALAGAAYAGKKVFVK